MIEKYVYIDASLQNPNWVRIGLTNQDGRT